MSVKKVVSEKETLTYFEPLKDDNALSSSSNVLQIVYNFFGAKRGESERRKKLTNENSGPQHPAARPNVLNLAAQRGKRKSSGTTHDPGSEVELRLRSLSSMLWDFPKLRRASVQNEQPESSDEASTNTSPIPSSAELRQYWMPDEQCRECYECGEKFTTFRRKHHCRICGQIFCSRCCNQLISGKFMGHPGMLRSCTYCCQLVLTFAQGNAGKSTTPGTGHTSTTPNMEGTLDDSSRDISSASDSAMPYGNTGTVPGSMTGIAQSNSTTNVGHRSSVSGKFRHETTVTDELQPLMPSIVPATLLSPARDLRGWKRPNYIFDATPDVSMLPEPDPEVENELVQDSAQLHLLWRRISDEKEGLEFRDHRFRLRKYSSCITGQELVDWLLRKDIASTRAQACAIGQALFEGKWLKSIVDIGGVFQDGYVLFQSGHKPAAAFGGNNIEIYPDHFANFSGEETDGDTVRTLAEQEPMWVQEIKCENDDDDEGSGEFYERLPEMDLSYLDGQANFDESLIYSDDDKSLSEKSILSLSSFVEIDEDNDVIKYRKRSSMVGDSFPGTLGHASTSPQPSFDDSCLMSISADYLRNFLTWHGTLLNQPWIAPSNGWREGNLQSAFLSSRDKKAFQWLREVYLHHNLAFLKQLLHDNELDLSWAEVLVPLAKHAADSVSPNPDLNIDVCHYVHIKKLMDAPRSESQVINGVACTKNVVHKQMKTDILEPSILLLAIPLEYQRVQLKLATLDPIVRQEREFYKHLVSRITARQPHVVLVQCTVSHIAQELLLKAGITLVINVKSNVMERVARATEADIVYSIDRLLQAKLGRCSRFYVKHHLTAMAEPTEQSRESGTKVKTLMYFDGCNPIYGCTVILRRKQKCESGTIMAQELMKVQSVLRFLVQAIYHARLELSYLIDQQEFGQLLKKVSIRKQRLKLSSSKMPKPSVSNEECIQVNGLMNGIDSSSPVHSGHFSPGNSENNCLLPNGTEQSPVKTSNGFALPEDAISSPLPEQSQICFEEFIDALSKTLLSTSPLIRLTLPFLYSDVGLQSLLHRFLPNRLFWSRKFDERFTNGPNGTGTRVIQRQSGLNRSRSSTVESLLQDKIWLSPPHHHTSASADHDESTMSAETLGSDLGSRDVLNEESSTAVPTKERTSQRSSYYSQHFKRHQRDMSTSSADSAHGSSTAKLHSWEQKVMDQVFPVDAEDLRKGSLSPILQVDTSEVSPLNIPYEIDLVGSARENTVTATSSFSFHDFVQLPLSEPASSDRVKDLLASFRAQSGPTFPNWKSQLPPAVARPNLPPDELGPESQRHPSFPYGVVEPAVPFLCSLNKDCLDPSNHQHICALFSSYSPQSPNAPYACVLPWVVDIEFYRGNDITLGGFLERYCFRPSYHCPNSNCRRPMVEHVRSFVHGNTCLTIVLKELSKPFQQSTILTWNWNYDTQKSSEIKTMSHDAWSMSFAKYLELRLEGLSIPFTCSVPSEKPNILDQEVDLLPFTSFQYFLYGDMVAAFKCFPVSINDVVFPSHILVQSEENPSYHTCQLDDEICDEPAAYSQHAMTMKALSEKTYDVLDNILVGINAARSSRPAGSTDSLSEEIQAGRDHYFDDLLNVLSEERSHLREEIDSVQLLLQSACLSSETSKNLGFEDSFETGVDERASPKNVPVVDEDTGKKLSSGMLKLKCEICGLVETWNQKLEEVHERDRSSSWGIRIPSTGSSPLLPRRTGEELRQNQAEEVKQDAAPIASPRKSSINTLLEDESIPAGGVECDQDKVPPARQTLKRQKMSFSLESKISSSSYKRMSRTGSSVRLLVTRLLPGNTLIPSIPMPFPADEHYLLEECVTSEIIVRDTEPASIIAYALRSEKYKCTTEDYNFSNGEAFGEEISLGTTEKKASSPKHQNLPSSLASSRSTSPSILKSDGYSGSDVQSEHSKSLYKDDYVGASNSSVTFSAKTDSLPQTPGNSPHVEVQFSDRTTKFYCKVYFASMFESFRAKVLKGGEAQYLDSMSRSIRWVARGGKSGSTFHKTRDDQFILKQMSYFELQSFLEFAPKYMDYVLNSIESHKTTTISKILGVYRISFRNSETNRSMKQDVLVIENLFYQRKIKQIFDLKGSVRNRHVKPDASPVPPSNECTADHHDVVLLDENLLKLMSEKPLYVHEHTKHLLRSAITRDTNFLSANLIMDYSLLAGVEEGNQIVIGIIDFIRTFTWDKKLEMVVKSYGMFGGRKQTNKTMPTVVSPELYKNRFCEAMDRYFQVVPDRWYGMHAY